MAATSTKTGALAHARVEKIIVASPAHEGRDVLTAPNVLREAGGSPMSCLGGGSMTCIDLQARFGRRYRVSFEADGATRSQWPESDRPWLLEIRGRSGVVYPQGGEILVAMTPRPRLGAKLRALPCVLTARGDTETVVAFHVDDAPAVFALLKPYKRRQVSAAERERLAALRARTGIGAERPTRSDFPAAGSTIGGEDDAGHVPPAGEAP
jgi:hypothetical protein